MDLWNRSVAAVTLGLAALLLVGVGLGSLLSRYPAATSVSLEADDSALPPAGMQRVPRPPPRNPELLRLRQRTAMLEEELEKRNRAVESLQDNVGQLERERNDLRQQRDASMALVNMMSTDAPGDPASDAALDRTAVPENEPPAEEPAPAEIQRQMELVELREQLEQLQALFDAAQLASDRELALLRERETALRGAITAAFVRVGPPAVPGLIASLENEHAEVRRWAAETLESLGPDGQAALNALALTQNDSDPQVRAAVQRAIRAIQN